MHASDHLTYRWLRGKYAGGRRHFAGRRIMAFRHTLFWHIGDASAVGNAGGRHRPRCYALTKEWLFEQESFHVSDCPDDDIWPCRRSRLSAIAILGTSARSSFVIANDHTRWLMTMLVAMQRAAKVIEHIACTAARRARSR